MMDFILLFWLLVTVEIGEFRGFKVKEDINFDIIEYADGTILIGEGTWDNLWSIKTILRSFEMLSGPKMKFFKSKLYGLNLDDSLTEAASSSLLASFIVCYSGSLAFR
jgi:hypothetical protein